MTIYTFRDARRQIIDEALAALNDAQVDLRAMLEAEQRALQTDDWTLTDDTYLAVANDWLWSVNLGLKAIVDSDPALTALGRIAALTDAQAVAVEVLPRTPVAPPPGFFDQVRAALAGDETVLSELIHTAHRLWILMDATHRAHPFDDVGVLLPLRLETLFDAPASQYNENPTLWKLSLRVTPDEASIRRDNPFVSPGEQTALVTFWQAIQQPGDLADTWLEGDDAGVAWQLLCNQVTAPRAAWLVATIEFHLDGETVMLDLPADMPTEAPDNRVEGLPPELHVFAVDAATTYFIGRLPMEPTAQIDAKNLTLPLPAKLEEEKERWWASWKKAKEVGLGGEWALPAGVAPQTIRAIYVVGIGDETPDMHFKAQVDAGEAGILRLGTSTNAVQGAETADLGRDATNWQKVAQMRLRQRLDPLQNLAQPAAQAVQLHLTGRTDALPFFPGADTSDDTQDSREMTAALFPALWGHWLRDVWQSGDDMFRLALWAFDNLAPEGLLMPLRIAEQPYGLLPVTALSQWQVENATTAERQAQRQVEKNLAETLVRLRQVWAAAINAEAAPALRKRSVVGKSTAEFMELLAQDGYSSRYLWRYFMPLWVGLGSYNLQDAIQQQAFIDQTLPFYQAVMEVFGREPAMTYITKYSAKFVRLPLVQPSRMTYRHIRGINRERLPLPDLLQELYAFPVEEALENYDLARMFQRWRSEAGYDMRDLAVLPNSLLIRLLVYAVQTAYVWRREMTGSTPAEEKTLDYQQEMAITLGKKIDDPSWHWEDIDPLNQNERIFSLNIAQPRLQQLERAFRATLDTAANRIDPWVTGFAWQRLRQHSSSPRHMHRLGAYGWVDGPFDGQPGPTDAGRLHTPSYSQTLAALILRDKYLSSERVGLVNDLNRNPWGMNISSSKARLAEEFADEVRMGFHIYEIVGRHVENIIGDHQKVKSLRTHPKYAMYPERLDPHEVCNGHAALLDLLNPDSRPFSLTGDQERRLQLVADSLDTYADLHMADGIMQLVNRQLDKAADTMDATAGFSRPPSFEFTRTPPSGYQLESIVVSVLPFVPVETLDASASPARLVDPSVAAFLDAQLGSSNWAWEAINDDDNTVLGLLSLADFALTPADTLTLSDELLRELVRLRLNLPLAQITEAQNRAWDVLDAAGNPLTEVTLVELAMPPEEMTTYTSEELHNLIRMAAGAPADALVQDVPVDEVRIWIIRDEYGRLLSIVSPPMLGLTPDQIALLEQPELYRLIRQSAGVPLVRVKPPRAYWLTQQLAASLGARPAAGRDFIKESVAQQASDAQVYEELRGRYVRLYTACSELVDALLLAGDDAQRNIALGQAIFWGATTTTEAADHEALMAALLGLVPPPDATPLAILAETTAKTIQKRLALAPKPEDLPAMADIAKPLPDNVDLKKKRTPDGVPTLAQALATLAAPNAKLTVLACWQQNVLLNDTKLVTATPDTALDEDWLTVVAATRAPLARLEALQLELEPPLDTWSSKPSDPWQQEIIEANRSQRELKPLGFQTPRFAAAYGNVSSWAGEQVAVGIIDTFSEAVPMPQRSTSTAFGFNAPAARAPQAILLAVPPRPRQRIDVELLLQIVVETRELAQARTVRMEDLEDYQMLTPSMWLQASPPIRAWLQPYPLFE